MVVKRKQKIEELVREWAIVIKQVKVVKNMTFGCVLHPDVLFSLGAAWGSQVLCFWDSVLILKGGVCVREGERDRKQSLIFLQDVAAN